MTPHELSALARNIRFRNGRRAIPKVIPLSRSEEVANFFGQLLIHIFILAAIAGMMYTSFSIAESQYTVLDQINQENVHVVR